MKIAVVSPFLFRYLRGIERFTVELANNLARLGRQVHILTWYGKKPWAWGKLHPNVVLHPIHMPRYYQAHYAAIAYTYLFATLRPDSVLINFIWHGETLPLRVLPSLINKTYYVLHYPAEQVPHRYQLIRESGLIDKGLRIVSVSRFVDEGAKEWFGGSHAVIPNGVNLEKFYPRNDKGKLRESLGIPRNAFVLLTVAALERRKGVHTVLSALPEVLKTVPNLLYLVAGSGPEYENLQRQISELGLEPHVRLLGNVDNPLPIYQAANLFLFLSKGEALPLAPLEAMACGLPMIAARYCPLDEICAPLGTCFVDASTQDQIVDAIVTLWKEPEKRFEMGIEGRRHVEKHYSWPSIAKQYLKLFEKQPSSAGSFHGG